MLFVFFFRNIVKELKTINMKTINNKKFDDLLSILPSMYEELEYIEEYDYEEKRLYVRGESTFEYEYEGDEYFVRADVTLKAEGEDYYDIVVENVEVWEIDDNLLKIDSNQETRLQSRIADLINFNEYFYGFDF